jgi:hypothetical protein
MPGVYSERGYNSIMSVFRPDRLPSLSRLPAEVGREERFCEACGEAAVHILYRVPKKVIVVYIKDHPESLHATCIKCARSTVLTGEERERALSSIDSPDKGPA